MSEKYAEILGRGERSPKSSYEAWEELQELNAETDWDIENMLPEPAGSDTDTRIVYSDD